MKKRLKNLTPAVWMLTLWMPAMAPAANKVWLIGGGNHIENSQGQIEQNVIWLEQLLRGRVAGLSTYYSAGLSDVKDVSYWAPREESAGLMQPLARVFAGVGDNGIRYKRHQLSNVRGATDKASLVSGLTRDFDQLRGGDDILLVYNGHGGLDEEDTHKNHFKLWGNENLTVAELDRLLDKTPAETTARFILTQCYSGAFHQLIYETPTSRQFSRQRRCGFMSESAWRQAEGCALGVNKEEFRDYTTYFFAALSGRTRLGTPLASDPDLNGDDKVSFREAHLYTLRNAHSGDLSRSTSETYLERWQPWYLRWDSSTVNERSEYWNIAAAVAERNGWTLEADSLRKEKERLRARISDRNGTLVELIHDIERKRDNLQTALRSYWPELFNPYTYEYHRVIAESLGAIQQAITAHPDYGQLVESQRRYLRMQQEILALERTYTQIGKIFRLKKLARLEAWFERYADEGEKAQRQQLLDCEEGFID